MVEIRDQYPLKTEMITILDRSGIKGRDHQK